MRSMKTFFTEPTLFADESAERHSHKFVDKVVAQARQYRIGGYVREDSGNSEENLATHISKERLWPKPKCYSLAVGTKPASMKSCSTLYTHQNGTNPQATLATENRNEAPSFLGNG